ncbi:MAG: hypothetical protein ACPIOQ_56540, partial [Promethearchaeia archaeon]
ARLLANTPCFVRHEGGFRDARPCPSSSWPCTRHGRLQSAAAEAKGSESCSFARCAFDRAAGPALPPPKTTANTKFSCGQTRKPYQGDVGMGLVQ